MWSHRGERERGREGERERGREGERERGRSRWLMIPCKQARPKWFAEINHEPSN
jgi:hypothetical protein